MIELRLGHDMMPSRIRPTDAEVRERGGRGVTMSVFSLKMMKTASASELKPLHRDAIVAALQARHASAAWLLPGVVEVVSETCSTNTDLLAYARRMGDRTPQRSLLVTQNQTQGRGRHGRSWDCPAGAALALSIGLRSTHAPAALGGLTLLCGLAVKQALAQAGAKVGLKWPNDVLDLATRQKLSGVLVELQPLGDKSVWLVIGIGINLEAAPAGAAQLGQVDDLARLITDIVMALEQRYAVFEASGFEPLMQEFNDAHLLQGEPVMLLQGEHVTLRGHFAGINASGEALIQSAEQIHLVSAGELRLRREGKA
ncbi:MAG: biotin--[acetyl-CoA-carboxylase] ligase [Burkholderiales bacterium]